MLNSDTATHKGTTPRPPARQSLADVRKHLRWLSSRHAASAYKLCQAVCALADDWDNYREEAGCEIGRWLSENVRPTKNLEWYRSIVAAHDRMGTHAHMLEASAALYVSNKVTNDDSLRGTLKLIARRFVEGKRSPLTSHQVRNLLPELRRAGSSPLMKRAELTRLRAENRILLERVQRLEERNQRLEAQIRGLGAEPVM